MPRTAILYIAERCNQSCVFCLEEDGTWNEFIDPSTQQVMDTLAELRSRGADHITFMGGETFFRKDLPRILGSARRLGFTRVGVTTNGTVLSRKGFISDLTREGLDFIELSIHGHTPEIANAIGGTHFTFERQAAAMAEINAEGLLTIVNVVICRENKDHLVSIARYLGESFPNIKARFKYKLLSLTGLALERARAGDGLRLRDIDLIGVGDHLAARGVPYSFYNAPLCRLGAHAAHSHELGTMVADERFFDFDHRGAAEYYDSGAQIEGRVWPERSCGSCSVRAICPGLEEPYRAAFGDEELSPRNDDPLEIVRAALIERGRDPSEAEARLEKLRREPRPSRFIRARPEGAVRFTHAEAPEPLDLIIELRREGARFYAETARFALSYRNWSGVDAGSNPLVMPLLQAAAEALEEADREGASLEGARAAVGRTAVNGWSILDVPIGPAPAKKRIPLPLLQPDGSAPARP